MTVPNWASILEGLPDAVWLVDPSTLNLLAVNRAGADLIITYYAKDLAAWLRA